MALNRATGLRCFHRSYLTALIRSLLWISLLSSGGGLPTAMADPRSPAGEFELEAPDDVYVTTVAQDGQVQANSVVLVLESPMPQYWRLSIDAEKNQVDVTEQKYLNGRADEQRRMLEAKAAALSAASKASRLQAVSLSAHAEAGAYFDVDSARQALRDAKTDESASVEAASNARQEVLRQNEEKRKIAAQREKIRAENELYAQLTAHLTVKAVASGTFKSFVVPGSFIKKGHLLGKIAY